MKYLIKLHNYTYYHGFKSLVLAMLVLLAVATFVTIALPQVGAHIIHDLITGR